MVSPPIGAHISASSCQQPTPGSLISHNPQKHRNVSLQVSSRAVELPSTSFAPASYCCLALECFLMRWLLEQCTLFLLSTEQ